MKIIMFSINPIFPDRVTGGASKHLFNISHHLGGLGHRVEILCAEPEERLLPFNWSENVQVFPILPFNIPFPQPYNISGPDLALIIQKLSEKLNDADRFYIHDGEFLIPDVYQSIPTVASFRDNIYPESVMGSFIGKVDEIICVSEFSASVIKNTAGRFFPDLYNRIHQVNNGVDFDKFQPVDSKQLADELDVNIQEERLLLHPHRPEPGKGLPETIMVVDRLVHQQGLSNIKVLIPEWIDSMVSASDSGFYNAMMHLMQDLDVREHFKFIPWLPIQRMPELYSLGEVTLCLGNIVEAFGNVAYESMACGTPSIVARVGVHRSLMPDDLISKVHFGDIESAAKKIMMILDGKGQVNEEALTHLRSKMDFDRQVGDYADIILSCRKRERLQFSFSAFDEDRDYTLAPWCYIHDNQIYHDFRGSFESAAQLTELLLDSRTINRVKAMEAGVSLETWEDWIDHTWIVPVNE
jgi:glycosyltransferase involved in cell wall biosynthesis